MIDLVYGNEYMSGVSIAFNRVILKCKNKSCKHVWTLEYRKVINKKQCVNERTGRLEQGVYYYQRIANNMVISSDNDPQTCSECGRGEPTRNMVNGTLNDNHKCDARCLNATGPNCDCSCAGANHGANHA